jgi:heterodisulfide reductase subunit A
MTVRVLYRDMRTDGLYESAYRLAREEGVLFELFDPERPPRVADGDGVVVRWTSPETGEPRAADADLLVLSAGVVPAEGGDALGRLLRVPRNEDGFFLEVHLKLRPVEFAAEGVFLCGLCHGPKLVPETIAQAQAAAARAAAFLAHDTREVGGRVARVDPDKCIACLSCVRVCPFGAPVMTADGLAEINTATCVGCGTCVGECPARAITLAHFTDDQMAAEIEALFEEVQA